MFEFIFKMFIGSLSICKIGSFGEYLVSNSKAPMKCLTLKYQP